MNARTISRWLAGASLVAGALAGSSSPASAEGYEENWTATGVSVQGDFVPLVGDFDCDERLDIFWYAAGSAADYLWDVSDHDPFTKTTVAQTVQGAYAPFVGDFDLDQCDDIFWYAAGGAADHVWYGQGVFAWDKHQLQVNGSFRPVIGEFDLDVENYSDQDIYWYAPGTGKDYLWVSTGTRGTFQSLALVPQQGGNFTPIRGGASQSLNDDIIWYTPGATQHPVWEGVSPNGQAAVNQLTTPAGPYSITSLGNGAWLYAPGATPEQTITYVNGSYQVVPDWSFSVNGTFRLGANPSRVHSSLVVWHAPGGAQDYVWAQTGGA